MKRTLMDLARELKKKKRNVVTFISIGIGPLGTVTKELLKVQVDLEINRREETIQTTTLL